LQILIHAAINPGNSGGALVDINGNLVGINSMKIAAAQVEGIGFAIPSNEVRVAASVCKTLTLVLPAAVLASIVRSLAEIIPDVTEFANSNPRGLPIAKTLSPV
jgi:S1-C subfamily serine protease